MNWIRYVFAVTLLFVTACGHQQKKEAPEPVLVLVQGVHADGSIWLETERLLRSKGIKSIDLDRVGRDSNNAPTIKDLAVKSCSKIPYASIVVGHSYGGAIVNEMFGICSNKIQKIIYLAAVVPLNGEKPFDGLSATDQKNYASSVNFGSSKIEPRDAKTFFTQTDKQVDLTGPLPRLYPEWISLTGEAINFDQRAFDNIPKVYIETSKDHVLTMQTQIKYIARTHISNIDNIATGHFPMISNPKALANLLEKWSR